LALLPTLTAKNLTLTVGTTIYASNFISTVSDPNNFQITYYDFKDNGGDGGYFTLNGIKQANNVWITVAAYNLSNLTYTAGTNAGSETISIAVYDGQWSNYVNSIETTVLPPKPVVNVSNKNLNVNAVIFASDFILSVNNPNNLQTTAYDFKTNGSDGGYFTLNGVVQPVNTWITVSPSNLGNLVYTAGSQNGTENVSVASYDGQWSDYATSTVTVKALALPILVLNDLNLNTNTTISASKFVRTAYDPNNLPILFYDFKDDGGANGYFLLNNIRQPGNTWIQVAASELNNLVYVSGNLAGTETIEVSIYDDQWSKNQVSNISISSPSSLKSGTISPSVGSFLAVGSEKIKLSSLFNVPISDNNPKYIDVCFFDRLEYPFLITPQSGSLVTGSGSSIPLIPKNLLSFYFGTPTSDGMELGIVFTYEVASGRYLNKAYGYLDEMSYLSSPFQNDNTYVSVFSTNDLNLITSLQNDYNISFIDSVALGALAANNGITYNGSVDIVTRNDLNIIAPSHATPNSIVSTAMSFNGQFWNHNGCWVLASNISARAGATLPISSSGGAASLYTGENTGKPIANGEWIVAYYGGNYTKPSLSDVYQMIKPGDIVTMSGANGGHITTILSGSGATAMTFDNFTSAKTQIDANDVILGSNQSIAQEFNNIGAVPAKVTVYRLDTPTINLNTFSLNCTTNDNILLANYFSATDAGGAGLLPITKYAIYDQSPSDGNVNGKFIVGGVAKTGSAKNLLYVNPTDLSNLTFQPPSSVPTDKVYISAYNGSYWGDWSPITLNIGSTFDSYDGNFLTIPTLLTNGKTFKNVVVTVGSILRVDGGLPINNYDSYFSTGELNIPSVYAYGNTFQNVAITIGVIVSIDGQPIHTFG
jgi:hypothetical protein